MKIYTRIQKFDPDTGKPVMVKQFDHLRCDYTGKKIEPDGAWDDAAIYCSYILNYRDCDPCFGADGDEFEFGQKYNIDMFYFLSEEYHFIDGMNSEKEYTELAMMQEAIKNRKKKGSPWEGCFSFHAMCRTARILTATHLIEDGIIEAWQLSQEDEE